ncbi:MAG: metal-dependent hydrolase [Calditrichaeota bacterium]|nr:MAG: metal-dependent hydrolase [Calditrichota bacterium]MBL1205246.1 metal-dependent hydrolase [Calditrichota bacterium]NOG45075.1 metal-dependent hydrolase [Calditrichota bacterium]
MASAFAHAVSAIALKETAYSEKTKKKLIIWAIVCSILPDADVIGFKFGIDYAHWLGHRGFSHSIFFGLLNGFFISLVFFREFIPFKKDFWKISLFLGFVTASHGVLDAMTSGGLGIAFFAPFDNTRYFFPFRPIVVSPIGIGNFFSEWGMRVLISEFIWVGLPSIILVFTAKGLRRIFKFK